MNVQIEPPPGTDLGRRGDASPLAPCLTVIRPPRGWQLIHVRELWQFRDLVYFLAWRDVKVRYKQTVLGAAWAVLQPAMMMVVFTIFFSRMAGLQSGDVPYPLFVFAGLLPWTFFSSAVGNAGNSIIGAERVITKVYFPRLVVPFAAVAAALVDFLIAFGLLLLLLLGYGLTPGMGLLLAPLFFGLIVLGATGVGTLLAALNVAYRDFRYVMPFLLQLWMFATPSVYMQTDTASVQAGAWAPLLNLNPMTGLIAAFRAACLGGPVDWGQVGLAAVAVALVFVVGCFYFQKVEQQFADVI